MGKLARLRRLVYEYDLFVDEPTLDSEALEGPLVVAEFSDGIYVLPERRESVDRLRLYGEHLGRFATAVHADDFLEQVSQALARRKDRIMESGRPMTRTQRMLENWSEYP